MFSEKLVHFLGGDYNL